MKKKSQFKKLDKKIDKLREAIENERQYLLPDEATQLGEIRFSYVKECEGVARAIVKIYGKKHKDIEDLIGEALRRTQIRFMEIELKFLKDNL